MGEAPGDAVDLYWLPLGAGGHSVRYNGRVYEWLVARRDRRAPLALYHSALEVHSAGQRFVIESAPVGAEPGGRRGVVASGAVGARPAGALRLFRYEVRCWLDGTIPDVGEAVESPRRLSDDATTARSVLHHVRHVPTFVWGRDECATGDMWNSNSVVSWVLVQAGLDVSEVRPPAGGRAPGWDAGIVVGRG
jgi:hypothetical protein